MKNNNYSILYYIVKFNMLSKTRKKLDDWNLNHIGVKKAFYALLSFIFLTSLLVFILSFYISKKYMLPHTYLQLLLVFIFIEQIASSLSFFKNNRDYFLKDERKIIHQNRRIRIVQLKSVLVYKTIEKAMLTSILILIPVLLALNLTQNSIIGIFDLLLILLMYFFVNFFFSLLFSYIPYILSILWSRALKSFIIKIIALIINLLVPVIIGFFGFYLLNKFNIVQSLYELSHTKIFYYFKVANPYQVICKNNISTDLIIVSILAVSCVLVYIIWSKTLERFDLIEYTKLNNRVYSNTIPLANKKKIFYCILHKDRAFLLRIDGFFFRNLGNMLFLVMFFLGFGFPFILRYFSGYPVQASIISAFLISSLFYQLVGDAIKMILSVELDLKNYHIFYSNVFNLWELAKPKLRNYNLIVWFLTIFLTFISFFWQPYFILIHFVFFIIFLCNGYLYSLIQTSSVLLYPKKNWEHFYEIGESSKAKTFQHIYEGCIFVIILQMISLVSFLLMKFSTFSSIILLSLGTVMIVFTLLNYLFSMLYLKKINMNERYILNDRD